jgi:hypothetical protein
MPQPLGDGVQVTEEADGVHYRMPLPLGRRLVGVLLLVPLVAFVAFLVGLTVSRLADIGNGNPDWADTALVVFAWGGFAYSVYRLRRWMLVAWLLTFGHGSLRLRAGTLTFGLVSGGARSEESVPLADVRRIVVRPWPVRPDRPDGDVVIVRTSGVVHMVTIQLRLDTARLVAQHLAERCHLPAGGEVSAAPEVGEERTFTPVPVYGPPASTRVVVEEFGDGVTITVPPVGVWRAAPVRFVGALVYVAALVLLIAAVLILEPVVPNPDDVVTVVGCGLFHWVIALTLLWTALSRGRRRGVLAVAGGHFTYLVRGVVRGKTEGWPVGEVADIRVGVVVGDLNAKPELAIHVTLTNGQFRDLFPRLKVTDQVWVAENLRRALGMPQCDPPPVEAVTPTRPSPGEPAP